MQYFVFYGSFSMISMVRGKFLLFYYYSIILYVTYKEVYFYKHVVYYLTTII